MQEKQLRPRSQPEFPLIDHSGTKTSEVQFFVLPESSENRRKMSLQFSLHDHAICAEPTNDEAHRNDKAVGDSVTHIPSLLNNALTLIRHHEKQAARVLVYKALALDSENHVALKMAAGFLNPITDLPQLIKIQRVICRTDFCFETVSELAHLLYRQGDDQAALEKYHEALAILISENSHLFEIYKNIGNILVREKDFDGAEEFYNKAFTINSDSDALMVNLGTLAMQRQDLQLALTRFRNALQTNCKNDKAWVGLALVHQSMGDLSLAIANVQSALDIAPANRTAVHLFSSWSVRDGQYGSAIERLQDYLAEVDHDEEMSIILIQLFCQIHRLDLAQIELERVFLWNPQNQQLQQVESEIRQMRRQETKVSVRSLE